MNRISDFADSELWIIKSTLQERYGETPDVQLAETELRLDLSRSELSPCPAAYWEVDGCHFIIAKSGDNRFRCQFFYRIHQMYGTGRDEYDDLAECVVTLLQVQADKQIKDASENG